MSEYVHSAQSIRPAPSLLRKMAQAVCRIRCLSQYCRLQLHCHLGGEGIALVAPQTEVALDVPACTLHQAFKERAPLIDYCYRPVEIHHRVVEADRQRRVVAPLDVNGVVPAVRDHYLFAALYLCAVDAQPVERGLAHFLLPPDYFLWVGVAAVFSHPFHGHRVHAVHPVGLAFHNLSVMDISARVLTLQRVERGYVLRIENVPVVSAVTPKLDSKFVDEIFTCYDETVTVQKKFSLEE